MQIPLILFSPRLYILWILLMSLGRTGQSTFPQSFLSEVLDIIGVLLNFPYFPRKYWRMQIFLMFIFPRVIYCTDLANFPQKAFKKNSPRKDWRVYTALISFSWG